MSWEWVIFLSSVIWAIVAILAIVAWAENEKTKPRSIVDLLRPSGKQLTTLSIQPYGDDEES